MDRSNVMRSGHGTFRLKLPQGQRNPEHSGRGARVGLQNERFSQPNAAKLGRNSNARRSRFYLWIDPRAVATGGTCGTASRGKVRCGCTRSPGNRHSRRRRDARARLAKVAAQIGSSPDCADSTLALLMVPNSSQRLAAVSLTRPFLGLPAKPLFSRTQSPLLTRVGHIDRGTESTPTTEPEKRSIFAVGPAGFWLAVAA